MSEVYLISHTPNPEKLVAISAKNCYSNLEIKDLISKINIDDISKFIKFLFDCGHLSPFEHANFTFCYTGVSRSLMSQLSRHRLCSYSIRSQRYVKHDHFDYYIPESIKNSKYFEKYKKLITEIQEFYNEMKDISNNDRRYILPESCTTQIIHTANARELLHIFNMRCCNLASEEIRNVAIAMLKLVKQVAPNIFSKAGPKCFSSDRCSEGKRSCGKMIEVQKRFKNILGE